MNLAKPLLIYTHGAGRLGNQLFAYAHLVAFLLEHPDEFDFINFSFIRYAGLLKHTYNCPTCTYPTQHQRLSFLQKLAPVIETKASSGFSSTLQTKLIVNSVRLFHSYGAWSPKAQSLLVRDIYYWSFIAGQRIDTLDLALQETVTLFKNKPISVLSGWGLRSWSLLEKHSTGVREAMALHPQYEDIAYPFMNGLRNQYDFLIGVVIRQGDYRSSGELFQSFLFETDQYVRWMQEANQAYSDKGKVGFVVTSDEPQDREAFDGLNIHFGTGKVVGMGHYVENLLELSLCDLVMTPASTFGAWAAFWGNIPIVPLYDTSKTITMESTLPYMDAFEIFDTIGNKFM
jgi:hypothetical protein